MSDIKNIIDDYSDIYKNLQQLYRERDALLFLKQDLENRIRNSKRLNMQKADILDLENRLSIITEHLNTLDINMKSLELQLSKLQQVYDLKIAFLEKQELQLLLSSLSSNVEDINNMISYKKGVLEKNNRDISRVNKIHNNYDNYVNRARGTHSDLVELEDKKNIYTLFVKSLNTELSNRDSNNLFSGSSRRF